MSMDLFQQQAEQSSVRAAATSEPDLPATFGETFGTALTNGMLFGQSIAHANARTAALSDLTTEITQKLGPIGIHGAVPRERDIIQALNDKIAAADPSLGLVPITEDDLERRAADKARVARREYRDMSERERTWGGTFGNLLGGVIPAAADPVNVLSFPLAAPAGAGVLKTGLAWAGIGGGSQAVIEAAGMPFREQIQPGYQASGEPLKNILEAAAGAGVIGGGIRGLGQAWETVSGRLWPRSVRDAGNAVNSERQVLDTNPFPPGVDGEIAHRAAVEKSVDDLLAGRPVAVDEIVGAMQPRALRDAVEVAGTRAQDELPLTSPAGPSQIGEDLTPKRRTEVRAEPETDDAVLRDLDRLRANKDIQVPFGETIDAHGERVPLMRSVDDVLTEIESREKAAVEIRTCIVPVQEAPQ